MSLTNQLVDDMKELLIYNQEWRDGETEPPNDKEHKAILVWVKREYYLASMHEEFPILLKPLKGKRGIIWTSGMGYYGRVLKRYWWISANHLNHQKAPNDWKI